MKSLSTVFTFLLFTAQADAACDLSKTARQTVKALVAIEDMKGITAFYGGLHSYDPETTTINVQPVYGATKDWYIVKLRNKDCRVLNVELKAEKLPVAND